LLAQQISMRKYYRERKARAAPPLLRPDKQRCHTAVLVERLPFHLTRAQQRCGKKLKGSLRSRIRMHRLLQGDVAAASRTFAVGFARCAPSRTACRPRSWRRRKFSPSSISESSASGSPLGWKRLAHGSQTKKERESALAAVASGKTRSQSARMCCSRNTCSSLAGLAVVDEQHRFGVAQRLALRRKRSRIAQLMMSATPIPRTLSMS